VEGSPAIAAWLAHLAFWGLLCFGLAFADLSLKRLAMFLSLWCAGLVGLPYAPYEPARTMFSSYVAILDIALVFTIFKDDVRLT
jgi:hypothetical protein